MDFNRKEHCKKIAASGGKAVLKQHGTSYFSELVKKRWAKKKISLKKP